MEDYNPLVRYLDLEKKIQEKENELNQANQSLEEAYSKLQKENEDVKRMEKTNASTLFLKLTGNYHIKKDQEISEAFNANRVYQEVLEERNEVERNIASLKEKQSEIYASKEAYEQAYQSKKQSMLEDEKVAKLLNSIEGSKETIEKQKSKVNHLENALVTIKQIEPILKKVADHSRPGTRFEEHSNKNRSILLDMHIRKENSDHMITVSKLCDDLNQDLKASGYGHLINEDLVQTVYEQTYTRWFNSDSKENKGILGSEVYNSEVYNNVLHLQQQVEMLEDSLKKDLPSMKSLIDKIENKINKEKQELEEYIIYA